MIIYDIPGMGKIKIENIVFDYNGTIAVDGKLLDEVKNFLIKLKDVANVYVLTADTYGTVEVECCKLGINIRTFPKENASYFKKEIVDQLGCKSTICIGNGFNDIEMFKICGISIAILGEEGCSGKLLANSDIVVKSIEDAINIILNENRMKATLRT